VLALLFQPELILKETFHIVHIHVPCPLLFQVWLRFCRNIKWLIWLEVINNYLWIWKLIFIYSFLAKVSIFLSCCVWSVADTVFLINVNITRIRIRWSWFCKNKRLWNIIKQLRHKINAAFNYCILLLNWIVTAWLNFFLQIQYSCCEHRVFDSLLSSS
jgi:hypothetical protein